MNYHTTLKVGDIVRKVHGRRLAKVTYLNGDKSHNMDIEWLHTGKPSAWQSMRDYVLATDEEINAAKGATGMELFEVSTPHGVKIATKLMEKSKDIWIMEVKGSGEVIVTNTSNIKEIIKYTIEVKYNTGKIINYEASEGQYKVDEVFLMGNTLDIARVSKVDSKCKSATAEFKPFAKLVVEI